MFVDDVAAVGSLKSNESVVLRPEIAGRIAAIHLREGMPAAKGAVLVALDGESALRRARQALPDVVLLDAVMPGMEGFEVARQLKADPATAAIPGSCQAICRQNRSAQRGFLGIGAGSGVSGLR